MRQEYIVVLSNASVRILSCLSFKDEMKARDYYTDMLVQYPNCKVEFLQTKNK